MIPTKVQYIESQISLIINTKGIKKGNNDEDWEGEANKNVVVKVEDVKKERIEMKKLIYPQ